MSSKWIGAIFIIAGCGGCGFSVAAAGKREIRMLREFLRAVQFMECELQYKLTTLPELCRKAGNTTSGNVREVFVNLARELDWQTEPDAGSCMNEALKKSSGLPMRLHRMFFQLGATLGRFDLSGQLKDLKQISLSCEDALRECCQDQEIRFRSYRTLGLCAGAALAILLL